MLCGGRLRRAFPCGGLPRWFSSIIPKAFAVAKAFRGEFFDKLKQSCGLFFRPRLANPPAPTKKLWQEYCRSFFSLVYRTKPAKAMPDFQSAFYRDVQPLPAVGFFVARFFCCFQNAQFLRSRRPWSGSCPSRKIRNRAQNCSGHLQSGRKTGIIATVTCLSSSAG